MFILEDIFKPICNRKICCFYCEDKCKDFCKIDSMDCRNCFYEKQTLKEAKEIQDKERKKQ